MQQVKWMLNGALFTVLFCLIVTLTFLVVSEMQAAQADAVIQPVVTVTEVTEHASLIDAPLQRDITVQRFAPLEASQ